MALTSQQKHYIKKNIKSISSEQMSLDLGLPQKEISRYIKKRWPKLLVRERKETDIFQDKKLEAFSFKRFIADNINVFLLLFILVAVSYFNSLRNSFVSDDIAGVLKNPNIGNFHSMLYFLGFFQNFIYFLAHKIGGTDPVYYRSVNILCHLGSTFSIFIILNLLTRRNIAIFSSAIFAVHPIFTESVSWVSGMPYALYGFFFYPSLLFYILAHSDKKYIYHSVAFFFLAILCSEKTVALFAVFPLYELAFGDLKKNWKKIAPFFLMSLLLFIIYIKGGIGNRLTVLNNNYYQNASGFNNPFIQIPTAITTYLHLIFWPDKLSLYQTELSFSKLGFAFCVFVFSFFAGLMFYGWKKNRQIFFWLSFFVIVLSPTLTPLKVAWIVAERYAYVGVIGIIVVFAIFFDWLMKKAREEHRYAFYGIMILIVASLSIRTIYRNIDWRNEDNLWTATVKVSPSGAPIHNNMGDVYARHGDYQKAAEEFKKATEINPGYADAFHNLANTYQMAGQPDLAEKYYLKALSINPNIWQSYQNLAAIYYNMGDRQKALENMQKAVAINPTDQGLQNNLQIIQGGAITPPSNQ